jgi:hypothetical protein
MAHPLVEEHERLSQSTRAHKSAIYEHRRELRKEAARLEQVEARLKALGIAPRFSLTQKNGAGGFHGHEQHTGSPEPHHDDESRRSDRRA